MQTVTITGGTGMIGRKLTEILIQKGYHVIILTRNKPEGHTPPNLSFASWHIKKNYIDENAIGEADFIIHLTGAGVMDKRWTVSYKKEIVNSRIDSSNLLLEKLKQYPNKVKAIISASAIGWYGTDKNNNNSFTEEAGAADDFLAQTCLLWEKTVDKANLQNIRVVKLRTGIVLGNDGGAFVSFKKSLKFGIAGIPGTGKQICSWIHVDDLCRMYIYAMENADINGSYNAVAPNPVTVKQLILMLAKRIKKTFFIAINAPPFVLKLILGQRAVEILKSTTVSCGKIKNAGFTFLYPSLEAALNDLTKNEKL
ncbi:MAG: TIGR01777 family oxidoreductase [Ferruginibacter sp.]